MIFMLIIPCIVNLILKSSNKMTFFTVFYFLQAALHVSGETFTHHQELD
jgi:sugar phosphate permease